MNKKPFAFLLSLIVLFAPLALIFTYKTSLATASINLPAQTTNSNPASGAEALKDAVQDLMDKTQNKVEQGASQASKAAQQAIKDEIGRQVDQQVQNAKKGILDNIEGIAKTIGNKIKEMVQKIKNYFLKIFFK